MRDRCRAFTLVEALVVIAVVSLLVAILLPALAWARSAGRQAVCLSNLRGVGTALAHYQQTFRESYPFGRADQPLLVSPPPDPPSTILTSDHWQLRVYWVALMHDVAPWRESFASWVCPGALVRPGAAWVREDLGILGIPSYVYCNSFVARPAVWEAGAVPDPALLASVRGSDVSFPASKALAFDSEAAHLPPQRADRDAVPVLFVDGHVTVRRLTEATTPVVNPFTGAARALDDTPRGARGRDY